MNVQRTVLPGSEITFKNLEKDRAVHVTFHDLGQYSAVQSSPIYGRTAETIKQAEAKHTEYVEKLSELKPVSVERRKVEGTAADRQTFSTGAVRGTDANGTRYDLITPIGLRRLAETYAEGCAKYGESNWLKGFPSGDLLNHALKHVEMWKLGDTTEDHLAHAVWNLMTLMHFEETRPELINRHFASPSSPKNEEETTVAGVPFERPATGMSVHNPNCGCLHCLDGKKPIS